jgi:hypothetical protein
MTNKYLIVSVFCLFCLSVLGQSEGISPVYEFSIKKKIEPPLLQLVDGSLLFKDQNNNNALDAEEHAEIHFKVSNYGIGDALGLKAKVTMTGNKQSITMAEIVELETCKVNEEQDYVLNVSSGRLTQDGSLHLEIEVLEPNGFGLDLFSIGFETRSFHSPLVKVVDYSLTGGTVLKRKVPFDLQVLVQNLGQGAAESVNADLSLPDNVYCLSGNENENFITMAPGETRSIVYSLIVNQIYSSETIPLELILTEKYGEYSESWNQVFTLNQTLASSKLFVEARQEEKKDFNMASLFSDVDKNIPVNSNKYPHRYAIAIGNEDYASRSAALDPQVNVDYATHDAEIIALYFKQTWGIPENNIKLLKNATSGEIRQALSWLENVARAEGGEAELFFYYSGHGLPDASQKPYLIPVDIAGTTPEHGIALYDVYAQLAKYPTQRVHVILDACFSGGARGTELVAMKGMRVVPRIDAIPEGVLVMASSSGSQASAVYREKQHGYFTYFMLKQIQLGGIGQDYGSWFEEVRSQVDKETARAGMVQEPQVLVSPLTGDSWKNWIIE